VFYYHQQRNQDISVRTSSTCGGQPYIGQHQTQDLKGIKQQNQLIYLQLEATKGFLASDFHSLEAGDAETDFDSCTKKRI